MTGVGINSTPRVNGRSLVARKLKVFDKNAKTYLQISDSTDRGVFQESISYSPIVSTRIAGFRNDVMFIL